MRFVHCDHPGRAVLLAYCLNVHPAEDLAGVLEGLCDVAVPLARRLAAGRPFGVGLYLPEPAVEELIERASARVALRELCRLGGLDPFTFNAFPIGRFHRAGLKAAVFDPRWDEPRRQRYTLDVARLALELERGLWRGPARAARHLSISTHAGAHQSAAAPDSEALATGLGRTAKALEALRTPGDPRLVLAIEPEPRSSANDSAEWLARVPAWRAAAELEPDAGPERGAFGLCLDACHAAVEFEAPEQAAERARAAGRPLGKFQFTSALSLPRPGSDAAGRARLLAMDEPTFLHQTSGRLPDGRLLRAGDLPELGAELQRDPRWLAAEEWRCHFHVPLGQAEAFAAAGGLTTTQAHADRLLGELLADPGRWGLPELHLELETYTWSLLAGAGNGPGALVERLAGEYAHAFERLAAGGWSPAA
jgi:hypothetical protein